MKQLQHTAKITLVRPAPDHFALPAAVLAPQDADVKRALPALDVQKRFRRPILVQVFAFFVYPRLVRRFQRRIPLPLAGKYAGRRVRLWIPQGFHSPVYLQHGVCHIPKQHRLL